MKVLLRGRHFRSGSHLAVTALADSRPESGVKQSKLAAKSAFGGRLAVAEGAPGQLLVATSGSRDPLAMCGKISVMAHMVTLAQIACDAVLDTAYDWLCRRRRDYPADADVWSLRRSWAEEKERIRTDLIAGRFHFGLLTRITLKDGEEIDLWSARDALVLKALIRPSPSSATPTM